MTQERINEYAEKLKDKGFLDKNMVVFDFFRELNDEYAKEISGLKMSKAFMAAYAASLITIGEALLSTFKDDFFTNVLYDALKSSCESILVTFPNEEQKDNE